MAKLPAGRIEISPYTSASNCSDCSSEWLAGGIALAALFNVTMPSVAFTTNITESNFRYTQPQFGSIPASRTNPPQRSSSVFT